jgi:hypothetical protein
MFLMCDQDLAGEVGDETGRRGVAGGGDHGDDHQQPR